MHIHLLATGGTIATGSSGRPEHRAEALLAALPPLPDVTLSLEDVGPLPGASWNVDFLHTVRDRIRQAMHEADAVVVTQGTDSLEETAYLFDRWYEWPKPLVFTGAMRNPTLLSADGPGNLYLALRAASAPECQGVGVLVAMADEVHLATWVEKGWSQRLLAFHSPETGPFAWYAEDRFHPLYRPLPHRHFPATSLSARVGLVRTFLGMSAEDLPRGRYDALVLEGMGGGHLPEALLPAVDQLLSQGTHVVVVPRPTRGPALRETYAFPGSERDLLARGVLLGQGPGLKTRLRLWLALSERPRARDELAEIVAEP